MLDAHDLYGLCFVIDFIEDTIVTDTKPPVVLRACYFCAA